MTLKIWVAGAALALVGLTTLIPMPPAEASPFSVVGPVPAVPAELADAYAAAESLSVAAPDLVSLPIVESGQVRVMIKADLTRETTLQSAGKLPKKQPHAAAVQVDQAAIAGKLVKTSQGRLTREESMALRDEVVTYANMQARQEHNVVAAQTNPMNGKIHLLVKKWTPALSNHLLKKYPSTSIEVEIYHQIEPIELQDRPHDFSPYYGGLGTLKVALSDLPTVAEHTS